MRVDNLNAVGVAVSPAEAEAPLIVDPDAVLPLAIPCEPFQPVAGWHPQILKRFRRIEDTKLSLRNAFDITRELPRALSPEDFLSLPVTERRASRPPPCGASPAYRLPVPRQRP
jgi:hypothetical protein